MPQQEKFPAKWAKVYLIELNKKKAKRTTGKHGNPWYSASWMGLWLKESP
jgi:hypothetical protein